MCIPMSSKFITESTGDKIVKISQYLSKIWTKYDSLLFLGHPYSGTKVVSSFCHSTVFPWLCATLYGQRTGPLAPRTLFLVLLLLSDLRSAKAFSFHN